MWRQIDGNPAPPEPGNINSNRPYTSTLVPGTGDTITLADVVRIQKDGWSAYNALQAKIEKRYYEWHHVHRVLRLVAFASPWATRRACRISWTGWPTRQLQPGYAAALGRAARFISCRLAKAGNSARTGIARPTPFWAAGASLRS